MASPPPPYDNITGISRTVMKDNAQETLAGYDGNARPGELVVDLGTNEIYIGNVNGNLNAISTGSQTSDTAFITANNLELDFTHAVLEILHDVNITSISVTNVPTAGEVGTITVILTQDITGGRTIVGNFLTSNGTPLDISTQALAVNIATFLTVDGGSTLYAFSNGKNFI